MFYDGVESGCFLGKFVDPRRAVEPDPGRVQAVLDECGNPREPLEPLAPGFEITPLNGRHVQRLAELYGEVFASYPFPIDDPEFLRQGMDGDTIYYGVFQGDRLVAASSAELDRGAGNAEMTDFATLPITRGNSLAAHLLARMESDLATTAVRTPYTIARATSFGMNITFARAGYVYGGTLVCNTQIMGRLESMNVWYRRL
jgi:putative beta-lysine N-acetyltransferase